MFTFPSCYLPTRYGQSSSREVGWPKVHQYTLSYCTPSQNIKCCPFLGADPRSNTFQYMWWVPNVLIVGPSLLPPFSEVQSSFGAGPQKRASRRSAGFPPRLPSVDVLCPELGGHPDVHRPPGPALMKVFSNPFSRALTGCCWVMPLPRWHVFRRAQVLLRILEPRAGRVGVHRSSRIGGGR